MAPLTKSQQSSMSAQLNKAKSQLQSMSANLSNRSSGGGGSSGGSRVIPVSGPSSGLTAQQQAEEIKAQNIRWGVQPGESVSYQQMNRDASGSYVKNGKPIRAEAYTPSDFGIPAIAPGLPAPVSTTQPDVGDVITPGNEQLNSGMAGFNITYKDGKWVPSDVTGTDAATANYMNRSNSVMDIWNNRETGADIWNDVLKQTKRDQFAKEVGQYTGEINAIVAKRDADVLSLEGQGRGIPEVIIGGQQAQINREAAIRALPVQAMLATAQGNLEMANQQLTQLYQIRMADATAQTNFQLGVVNSLFDFADKKEQRQFETIQAEIARKDADTRMNITRMDEWAKMAVETNQPSLVGKINKLDPKSPTFNEDFAAITGQIVKPVAPTKRDTQVVDGNLIDMQTGEIIKNISAATTYTGQYSNVVDAAAGLLPAERGNNARKAISTALSGGDYGTAYAHIANAVEESLTGDVKTKFANARTDYMVMSKLRDAVEAYEAAGGDTGFLKGTADEITRKFGSLKTDPQFGALAVQLEREFMSFRSQMTGAAFSPSESLDYERVNPSTKKSIELNLATIDGAMNALEDRITSTIDTRVPGAEDLYKQVSNEVTVEVAPAEAEVGDIIQIGNAKYRKTGDDSYEFIEAVGSTPTSPSSPSSGFWGQWGQGYTDALINSKPLY